MAKMQSRRQLKKLSIPGSVVLFLVSLWISFFGTTQSVVKLPGNETFPAVLVFGDSIVDAGNNNNLATLARCNYPPYGRDFKGGVPTGRFSNGKVPPDFVAEELGVKELVPAYLDPSLKPEDLITGVTFASGGAGYDPLTAQTASATSLSVQLQQFKEYTEKLKAIVGEERTGFILSNSLFVVVVGGNDLSNTYFSSRLRESQYDISSYCDFVVDFALNFYKELYGLGARRIGAFGVPPIGCNPATRTLSGGIQRKCNETYNQAAKLFNAKFAAALDSLDKSLPDSRILYVDFYNPLLNLIQNPAKNGFEVADRGCCGTGLIEVIFLCNQLNPYTCPDSSAYIFWDSFHPTEKTYKIIVNQVLNSCVPKLFGNSTSC